MAKLTANPARATKNALPVIVGNAPHSTLAGVPSLRARNLHVAGHFVVCHVQVNGSIATPSGQRKAAGYAVGRTLQQCIGLGITTADIQWDIGPGRANVIVAAPGTPPALAALAIAAGEGTPAHAATIAAYAPHLVQAAQAAYARYASKLPATVATLPGAPTPEATPEATPATPATA
jgi:hypothetical protein